MAVIEVNSAGLRTTVLPSRQRGRDLPGQHQQREVPGNDLADDADGAHVGHLGRHQLRPAGVMVEVAGDERDVDVARLADRLAVVHRLEDGEQARVLLNLPRQRVEVAGADVSRRRAPGGEGGAGGAHGGVYILARGLRDLDQRLRVGWIDAGEILAAGGIAPVVVDEEAQMWRVRVEPRLRGRGRLRREAVAHRLEDLTNICCARHRRASLFRHPVCH